MDHARSDLLMVIAGIGGVLIFASAVGWVLHRRYSPDGQNAAIENLNDRIRAWWVMTIALALAFLGGRPGVTLLFALCSFAALREFMTLTNATRADHNTLAAAFFVVLPVQFWWIWIEWYGMYSIFIPVYAFLFLPAVAALQGRMEHFLSRAASLQWALMVCVYAVSYVPGLLQLPVALAEGKTAAEGSAPGSGGWQGAALMLFLVIVVQGSDVLQYVWGKTLGKHPVAPSVSPNKTWEGLIGGVLSATALGAALWWATPFAPWQAALLALVSCVMGFAGGLVMSSIKRDRGVKDFGAVIPGHGGIMDRFDSLVFAAPVFFHLVRFFFSP